MEEQEECFQRHLSGLVGLYEEVPDDCIRKNVSRANPLQALMGCGRGWVFSALNVSFGWFWPGLVLQSMSPGGAGDCAALPLMGHLQGMHEECVWQGWMS